MAGHLEGQRSIHVSSRPHQGKNSAAVSPRGTVHAVTNGALPTEFALPRPGRSGSQQRSSPSSTLASRRSLRMRATAATFRGFLCATSWRYFAALVHGSRALGEPRSTSWPFVATAGA